MIDTTGKTLQQVSDEIAGKLIKQGKKCTDGDNNGCAYGDDGGNHCGIGWLLDGANHGQMEHVGNLWSLSEDYPDLGINDAFIRENQDILARIQLLHDDPSNTFQKHNGAPLNLNLDAWQPWFDLQS
jgi:hypothetical protein